MIVVLIAAPSGEGVSGQTAEWPSEDTFVVAPASTQVSAHTHVAAGPGAADLLDALADIAAASTRALLVVDQRVADSAWVTDNYRQLSRRSTAWASRAAGDLRVVRGSVTGVGSAVHALSAATHQSTGVLVVGSDDLTAAEHAWREMARVVRTHGWDDHAAMPFATLSMVRSGIPVCGETFDAPGAPFERALGRPAGGPVTRRILRPIARPLSEQALRMGIGSRTVMVLALAGALVAALLAAAGTRLSLVLAAVVVQLWLVLDVVVADLVVRRPDRDDLTLWLNGLLSRVKELALLGGVAVGAGVVGEGVWIWAGSAAAVVAYAAFATAAHTVVVDSRSDSRPSLAPLDEVDDVHLVFGSDADSGAPADAAGAVRRWIVQFFTTPTSELLIALSLAMAVGGAKAMVVTALVWSAIAACLTLRWFPATRGPLQMARRLQASREQQLLEQCDPGVLSAVVAREDPHLSLLRRLVALPAGWLVPGLTWLVEASTLLALTHWREPDALPLAFVALAVIALHRYDTIYRRRFADFVAAPSVFYVTLGAFGRVVTYVVLSAVAWLPQGLAVMIVTWASVLSAEAATAWTRRTTA